MNTEEIVIDILSDVLSTEQLSSEVKIFDIGVDSFQILCIAMQIELAFSLHFPLDRLEKSATPRSISMLIESIRRENTVISAA